MTFVGAHQAPPEQRRRVVSFLLWLCIIALACGLFFAQGACGPGPSQEATQAEPQADHTGHTGPDASDEPAGRPDGTPPPERGLPPDPGAPADQSPPPERRPPADRPAPRPDAPPSSWVHPAQPYQGKATWYNADGTGNCSFPKAASPPLVAAMNESQYGAADLCGACVKVTGPKGDVIVTITDRCPECQQGHLDLSKEAFAMIADPKTGVIPISWQMIPCAGTAPMQYFYKDGSSQWWTAIQIRRHRIPITKVEAKKGGKWVSLKRERYNFFVDSGGLGDQPVTLRIHALNGQTREETIPAPASSKLHTGTQQF